MHAQPPVSLYRPAYRVEESQHMDVIEQAITGVEDPPGIVIHGTFGPTPRPAISAFIWGGRVRPVPELPYGRRPAA
jgi:hypothetical protein